jgi:hypothetical protein
MLPASSRPVVPRRATPFLATLVLCVPQAARAVGRSARVDVEESFDEARRQGYSADEYRAEIRRRLLEGKLVLRVRGRVHVTEEDEQRAKRPSANARYGWTSCGTVSQ